MSEEAKENTQESVSQEAPQEEAQQNQEIDYEAKFKELEGEYLRVHADFENVKKRLEREKYQALEYCYEGIAKDLLPVVDTLEKALESAKNAGDEAISEGIKLTLENLLKVLGKHGIEIIAENGEFDPLLHDAIMQVPSSEVEEGQIVQTLQKGYKYKERTLRPAMVSVAKN
ncbi:nucleotide exchange factor GrpE [Helicobacter kayseriensis]|uniref:nucleotide exchange factor GrpE n=1 Tax=Helicobacter kayseriensis TaxID=2905877 RepID=UPI001E5F3B93|nr:nucleotide exchange factor GrpE [Helicobacter kayseriensis]MCE3047514.1 nucleotide exchange factor GrpE [Helicobacter kayseriensis]MCE3048836.1 nucleotide exchange factor GrpE [Helicobacter kayseriensis]